MEGSPFKVLGSADSFRLRFSVDGAGINGLQIVKSSSIKILQLMNLTAITFIVGAVLFTVASVPYLWDVVAPPDRTTLYAFLAWQYLVGSLLFFAGGVFNYWRAYVFMRDTIDGLPRDAKGDIYGAQ